MLERIGNMILTPKEEKKRGISKHVLYWVITKAAA